MSKKNRSAGVIHRYTFKQLEPLEQRRLLAAAAAAVELLHDDHGHEEELSVGFLPDAVVLKADGGFLTGRQSGRRADLARRYITDHAAELGLRAQDAQSAVITNQYTDADTGATHVYMQQTLNGLPIQNTSLGIHFTRDGRVIAVNSGFVANLAGQQNAARADITGMIHPANALRLAAAALEVEFPSAAPQFTYIGGEQLKFEAASKSLSLDTIPIAAQYVATATGVELAWKMVLRLPGGSGDWYDISVNARTGQIIFADNWTDDLASYNVYPMPAESPADGPRQVVTDPHDLTASPFGWHDTNGAAGAEFTDTRGNNVSAQEDADNNNTGGVRGDGGAALNFDFPLDLTQAPSAYRPAAITNLFYWNNILHDVLYQYGFTEAAGNFQTNTYTNGGAGNDAVQADAQDGSGTSNANFSTPPDGSPGRMQMFIFTAPNPDRDGDLDAGIIAHEYGHGVSNRLTGGPANSSALTSLQSGGMGEGWSDFYSLMFTQTASDTRDQAYPVGTYVLAQSPTGNGIRRKPYSFDKSINPLTFEAFGTSGTTSYGVGRSTQVHNVGELWASALWDLNWLLIGKTGFDANLHSGYNASGTTAQRAGNKLAMKLVMDGMKLQPVNPSFVQARDAIMLADQNLTGGANARDIWLSFARRGLGTGAATASAGSSTLTTSFDVPAALFDPLVTASTPAGGTLLSPLNNFSFTFDEALNTGSFSVADDITSFTGPGGSDLKANITSAAFSNSNKTITVNFTVPAIIGVYSMTIGPNITAADNGAPMDQNLNGIPGEADDAFTTGYSLQRTIGPDAVGYTAAEYPYQDLNLVIGAPGVTTLLNGTDDGNALLTLAAGKTFNFYGTHYSSMSVSANGLISFGGTVTTAAGNGSFTSSPVLASIGVLYDDWRTDTSNGPNDSVVLYSIDSARNSLTIEWSDVTHFNVSGGSNATFQTILQLNTAAVPGRIINNYRDLDVGNAGFTDGASASVGIKDADAQGTRRLLVSQNTGEQPWVKTGKANILSLDVIAPTITNASYAFESGQSARFAFDESIASSAQLGAFAVQNLTTAQPLAAVDVGYDGATNAATLNLPTTLDDGNYRVTVNGNLDGSGIVDAFGNALDGDASGLAGGNYTFDFSFFRGDATRDRAVDLDDFTVLAANFGLPGAVFSKGDFNYDGEINLNDFSILASKFGSSLAPAAFGRAAPVNPVQSTDIASAAPRLTSPFVSTRLIDAILGQPDGDVMI